jgi:hypothetical protein
MQLQSFVSVCFRFFSTLSFAYQLGFFHTKSGWPEERIEKAAITSPSDYILACSKTLRIFIDKVWPHQERLPLRGNENGRDSLGRAHGTDERLSLENVEQLTRFFIHLIRNSNETNESSL